MSFLRTSIINALILTQNLSKLPATTCTQTRLIHRWVAPTLRELRKRAKKLGPQAPAPRASFIEWNQRAELFAFGKRLHEEFQMPLLQSAFTNRCYVEQERQKQLDLGIAEEDIKLSDNRELAKRGEHIIAQYVTAYLKHELPKLPADGQQAIANYLLSAETLAHVGTHLGIKEIILAAAYPPTAETLRQTTLAVVGALEQSSGIERAFLFVRDFICTQLNQRDLLELWCVDNAEQRLRAACKDLKMPEPEARLIGDCGRNTVLAAYHVGIYSNKQMMGSGFGEDVATAIETASINALQKLYGIEDSMRSFNFKLEVEPRSIKLTQN